MLDKRSLYSKQSYVFLFFDLNCLWRENDIIVLMQDVDTGINVVAQIRASNRATKVSMEYLLYHSDSVLKYALYPENTP